VTNPTFLRGVSMWRSNVGYPCKFLFRCLDSYTTTKHFASLVPKGADSLTPEMQHAMIMCETCLWKGNPMSTVTSFGENCCKLCNRERMEIIKQVSKTCLSKNRSTHNWKYMPHVSTIFQGSIGDNTKQWSVLISARSVKQSLWNPHRRLAREN
jgi:hypothetical protein